MILIISSMLLPFGVSNEGTTGQRLVNDYYTINNIDYITEDMRIQAAKAIDDALRFIPIGAISEQEFKNNVETILRSSGRNISHDKVYTSLKQTYQGLFYFYHQDDKPSTWAVNDVGKAIEFGLVPKRLQANYQQAITREEFAELIAYNFLIPRKIDLELYLKQVKTTDFKDTTLPHVKVAYSLGVISAKSSNMFDPHGKITRQEAAVMLANYSQANCNPYFYDLQQGIFTDFDQISPWALDAIDICWSLGIMRGTGSKFEPLGEYTREQAIVTMLGLYPRIDKFALGGIVIVEKNALKEGLVIEVGDDYVYFKYPTSDYTVTSSQLLNWAYSIGDRNLEPPKDEIVKLDLKGTVLKYGEEVARSKEYVKLDLGYMVGEFNANTHIAKFTRKPDSGYVGYNFTMNSTTIYYGRDRTKAPQNID